MVFISQIYFFNTPPPPNTANSSSVANNNFENRLKKVFLKENETLIYKVNDEEIH